MQLIQVEKKIEAEHGVVASFPTDFFGYFGWPSIARMGNGTLIVAASGMRNGHLCPFGRSVICVSTDDGRHWTSPAVVNDSPFDDRDTGIVPLEGRGLLLSWFSIDSREMSIGSAYKTKGDAEWVGRYERGFSRMTDEDTKRWVGSWVRISPDLGGTWADPIKVDLTAPHGPIPLRSGELLYLGKEFLAGMEGFLAGKGRIAAMASEDGRKWKRLGWVPIYPGSEEGNYYEPHAVELSDGKLLGIIRFQNSPGSKKLDGIGLVDFSLMQTESSDGGKTWTCAEPLGFHGSPPHLLRHSSGAVICVYGYRLAPYGERAMVSRDDGKSWRYHYILRDDGPGGDLGYPASVELADGSVLTIYYQKVRSVAEKCSLLWSRWTLPE